MSEEGGKKNWVERLKNHPMIILVIFIAAVTGGLAKFTDSAAKLWKMTPWSETTSEKKSPSSGPEVPGDLREMIIGNWRMASPVALEGGGQIHELMYEIKHDRTMAWRGSVVENGMEQVFLVRCVWELNDNHLSYEVMSSSIPEFASPGEVSSVTVVDAQQDRMLIFDQYDRLKKVIERMK